VLYTLVRAIAGVALRWYYRDVQIEGLDRIPREGPLLIVVNHPNALVDALLVIRHVPRRVLLTAKGTLFANPIARVLLGWMGVVPLHRASDAERAGMRADPARNRGSFRAVVTALQRGDAVMIFPEGKSHDEPTLAPLKSGAARMALEASTQPAAPGLTILPIGLSFERKDEPRTRVLVRVGAPLEMAPWIRPERGAADALTSEIDSRLRAVTLNYESTDDAARVLRVASVIAALFGDVPDIGRVDRSFGEEATIARRLDEITRHLASASPDVRAHADALLGRMDAAKELAAKHGVLLEDVFIPLDVHAGARFVVREAWWLVVGGPFAIWGRVNHWLPFRAARVVALRSVETAADPAMRTVLAGASFLVITYLVQTSLVAAVWGAGVALAYLVSLPLTADVNFYLSERLRRAMRRAHAYLLFRRDPALRERLYDALATLRADVAAFDQSIDDRGASVSRG
jgi:1-acyl-sn-glycerol-3-phosphate acyltransferase